MELRFQIRGAFRSGLGEEGISIRFLCLSKTDERSHWGKKQRSTERS